MKTLDSKLYNVIHNLGVEPQVFLIRWLRCVLAREFHLLDTLIVWDNIFLRTQENHSDNKLWFLDFLSIAMIIYDRRNILCMTDYAKVLQRLLKFPPMENIITLINSAQDQFEA